MRKTWLWQGSLLLVFLSFLFSCHKKSNLERALELAGKNRIELEKVLEHYGKDPADNLKLRAAQFLIENMDSYSFVTSPGIEAYYHTLDSIFSLNGDDELTEEQEVLLSQMRNPNPLLFKTIPDLQYVSAEFLIDNIDRAFEAWKSPFAKEMNFDDFCEYLLPYKAGATDHPDFWRSVYKDTFYPYIKSALDTICRLDSGLILHYPTIELNGENYYSIPNHFFDTVPEFTVCCWVNPHENRPWARIFDFGIDNTLYLFFVPYTSNGISRFEIKTAKTLQSMESVPLPVAQQSHIAVTYSENYISIYIDGILKKMMRTPLTNKNLICNYIGKSQFKDDPYFKGEIEKFCIYDRKLNHAEISALAGKTELLEIREQLLEIVRIIRNLHNVNITLNNSFEQEGCHPVQLINMKKGSCSDYMILFTYIFRSIGIPSGIDFIPQWGFRCGHTWNALYTGDNRMEDYSSGADRCDTVGYHIKAYDEKNAKIFRTTYAKQPESLFMQNKEEEEEDLPPLFNDPCIKDVTDTYLDCMDVTVSLTQPPPEKRQYVYLSHFKHLNWIPVYWSEIKGRKVVFTKMGKAIVYLPVYYDKQGIQPAAEPFILTKEGEIKKLIPNYSKTQTLILTRKYRPGNVPKKCELLVGGRFQVANKADFSDSLTIYVVNEVPEGRYNPVNLTLNKPHRYFRFLAPPNSKGGEISEIEIYSTGSELKLSGKVIGNRYSTVGWEVENVFDGDPLTSYKCDWGACWAGLDFGKPKNIAGFRYLPRNDDNFIKEGELY